MATVKIHTVISKLRVRTVREETWDLEDIGRELAKISTMDTGDTINYIYKLFDIIIDGVTRGIHMKLGKLCIVGISTDVDGNLRPSLRATSDLRRAVQVYEGRYKNPENRGLDDEGFARKWLEENLEDQVIMRDDSVRTRTDYGL